MGLRAEEKAGALLLSRSSLFNKTADKCLWMLGWRACEGAALNGARDTRSRPFPGSVGQGFTGNMI